MVTSRDEQDGHNGFLPYGRPVVQVDQDFMREALRIHIGIRAQNSLWILRSDGTIQQAGEYSLDTDLPQPFLTLPENVARVLLDALAAHFGGVSEARAIRADLLAERARVDQLIGTVSRIAENASGANLSNP